MVTLLLCIELAQGGELRPIQLVSYSWRVAATDAGRGDTFGSVRRIQEHPHQNNQTSQQGPFLSLVLAVATAISFEPEVVDPALVTSTGFPKPARTTVPIAPAPMRPKKTRRRTIMVLPRNQEQIY